MAEKEKGWMLLRAGNGALSIAYDKRLGWGGHRDTAPVEAQLLARWLALQCLLGCCSCGCTGAATMVQAPVGVLGWGQLLMLWKKDIVPLLRIHGGGWSMSPC